MVTATHNRFRRTIVLGIFGTLLIFAFPPRNTFGQTEQDSKVAESIDVLNEIMQVSTSSIPRAMLADAQAVAIVPRVIKGSFIVGARRGEGVVLVRDAQGNWQGPAFITLSGGNVGWQIGVQSTDVVLVFKTRTSVEHMLSGAFTIGADAAAAAGPVGRDAAIATDEKLKAEVYSYSRSRGLFAGVSIDGSVLKLDPVATSAYYNPSGTGQANQIPQAAIQLVQLLRNYTGEIGNGQANPLTATNASVETAVGAATSSGGDAVRQQLIAAAGPLYKMLDRNWQAYLALPQETFAGGRHPTAKALEDSLIRFDAVRSGPQYKTLADRPEFQTVYTLLKQYHQSQISRSELLNLPAPPSAQNPK